MTGRRSSDDVDPSPAGVFVAGLSEVGVPFEARPTSMPRHGSRLRDRHAHLEQSTNSFVAKVVKAQIADAKELARPSKRSTDGVGRVGKDLGLPFRHRRNDRLRNRWHIAIYVVAVLLAGILHIANQNAACLLVKIGPGNKSYFLLSPRRENRESNDLCHRYRTWATTLDPFKVRHETVQLFQVWPAVSMFAFAG